MKNDTTEIIVNGKKIQAEFYGYTRGGTKSPTSYFFLIGGHWTSPYEQKIYGVEWTFQTLFGIYIPASLLREELKRRDWLLKNCEKDSADS